MQLFEQKCFAKVGFCAWQGKKILLSQQFLVGMENSIVDELVLEQAYPN